MHIHDIVHVYVYINLAMTFFLYFPQGEKQDEVCGIYFIWCTITSIHNIHCMCSEMLVPLAVQGGKGKKKGKKGKKKGKDKKEKKGKKKGKKGKGDEVSKVAAVWSTSSLQKGTHSGNARYKICAVGLERY